MGKTSLRFYFSLHKSMAEAIEKGSKLLESIDRINVKSLVLEEK
jgi:hypothetical protein